MRKFIILLILASTMIFTSCGNEELSTTAEDGSILAEDEIYCFYYPPEWIIDQSKTMISVFRNVGEIYKTNIESKGETYEIIGRPNLSVSYLEIHPNIKLENYWDDYCFPLLNGTFSDIEVVSSEDIELGGKSAKRYDYTMTVAGMQYKYAQIFTINNNFVFILTYTTTPDIFEENIAVLDKATETFSFR